jgi:hypothetical protein
MWADWHGNDCHLGLQIPWNHLPLALKLAEKVRSVRKLNQNTDLPKRDGVLHPTPGYWTDTPGIGGWRKPWRSSESYKLQLVISHLPHNSLWSDWSPKSFFFPIFQIQNNLGNGLLNGRTILMYLSIAIRRDYPCSILPSGAIISLTFPNFAKELH